MKQRFYYSLLIVCFTQLVISFSSCSDSEKIFDEWNENYVYLQKDHSWELSPKLTLKHTPLGLTGGEVKQDFYVKLKRPSTQDVKVNLSVISENVEKENIQISSKDIVIKAGEMSTERITVSLVNMDFMTSVKEAVDYSIQWSIESVNLPNEIFISTINNTVDFSFSKEKYAALEWGKTTGTKMTNQEEWEVTLGEGVIGEPEYLVDKAANGAPLSNTRISHPTGNLEFSIDFKEKHAISSLYLMHNMTAEVPTKLELYSSDDGMNWKFIDTFEHKAAYYERINFIVPMEMRYLKYKVLDTFNGVATIANIDIYEMK